MRDRPARQARFRRYSAAKQPRSNLAAQVILTEYRKLRELISLAESFGRTHEFGEISEGNLAQVAYFTEFHAEACLNFRNFTRKPAGIAKFHGISRNFTPKPAKTCQTRKFHGISRTNLLEFLNFTEFHGISRNFTEFHAKTCQTRKFHGISRANLLEFLNFTEFHGISRNFTRKPAKLANFTEFHAQTCLNS